MGHRAPVVALGLIGAALSLICTLHAHGFIARLWEPLPAVSTGGWVLRAPPSPAPELDLAGFALIVVTALLGGHHRWRRHPVLPLATGVAVALTAASAVVRWAWQYASLGTTSTLFFLTTAIAVLLLALVATETHAAATQSAEKARARKPDWSALAGAGAILIGIWLLLWPETAFSAKAAMHGHLIGAFVVAIGALSFTSVGRPARWLNVAIGAWLFFAPALHGYALRGALQSMIAGLLLVIVSSLLVEPESNRSARLRGA